MSTTDKLTNNKESKETSRNTYEKYKIILSGKCDTNLEKFLYMECKKIELHHNLEKQ